MTGHSSEPHNPDELHLDESTGIFTLDNLASEQQSYTVTVTVTTTDGYNSFTTTLSEDLTIDTSCGPDSTTLTAPSLGTLSKAPNTTPVLSSELDFTTSNPTCAVTTYTLLEGDSHYILSGNDLIMKSEANQFEDDYSFIVEAEADGGATVQLSD